MKYKVQLQCINSWAQVLATSSYNEGWLFWNPFLASTVTAPFHSILHCFMTFEKIEITRPWLALATNWRNCYLQIEDVGVVLWVFVL